jgi:hypothetical protein
VNWGVGIADGGVLWHSLAWGGGCGMLQLTRNSKWGPLTGPKDMLSIAWLFREGRSGLCSRGSD